MARDLHGRIRRLERLHPSPDEVDLHALQLLAQLARRMWQYAPDLALVQACDTDRGTWRSIQEDTALMRGDWEEAVRLGAARAPRERSTRVPMDEAIRGAAGLGASVEVECRAREEAIESARRRLNGLGGSRAAPA